MAQSSRGRTSAVTESFGGAVMKSSRASAVRCIVFAFSLVAAGGLAAAPASAQCGNGVVGGGEECDPGGQLYCNGDPALGTCTTGAQCAGGVNCFFEASCCKFNCQYVGQGADCFDGNQCSTLDKCNNVGACVGTPVVNGTPCDDGLLCTTEDICTSGVCSGQLSVPEECDDGNPCTDDGCDLEGGCTHTFNTAPCDDGNLCSVNDTCSEGVCIGGPLGPEGCDDGNPCTDDSCNPAGDGGAGACVHVNNANPCDDGQLCTQNDSCSDGECAGTPYIPPSCNDDNLCTTDSCNPLANDGAGACSNTANTLPCDDGFFCTESDVCTGGACVGHPRTCNDDNSCTADSCDELAETCVHDVTGAAGDPCDDGSICTTGTVCDAFGACVGGSQIDCDDGIACTADTCHPVTGCRSIAGVETRECLDACFDGIDNDGDGKIDLEDPNCATLAAVQRFGVVSTRARSSKGMFAGSDVSVIGVRADGTCDLDSSVCVCPEVAPIDCLSRDLPCASDVDCRTAVAGTCDPVTDVCVCPPAYPDCEGAGRPCVDDDECDVAPFPRGPSLGGVCGYNGDIRAGTTFGFLASVGDLKFGKGSTLDRTLDLLLELATDGGKITLKRTSAPIVGPTVCSSDLDLVCEEDVECPPAVDICNRGQCTGHPEACVGNADCAPACDARRRLDDGHCLSDTSVACTTDAECVGLGGACVHPFTSTDGSSENFQLCDAVLAHAPAPPTNVGAVLAAIGDAIASYVPGPGELVDFVANCEACPAPETPDGDPSCGPCPDATEVRTAKLVRKITVTVGGGLQILDLRRVRLAGRTVMRINGQDDTVLVVRVARNLRLGGEAEITVGSNGSNNGTLRVENVLWNVEGRQGGQPNFIRECLFQGTVLAPERPGIRVGSGVRLEGAIFSKKIMIGGPSSIIHVPFTGYIPLGS